MGGPGISCFSAAVVLIFHPLIFTTAEGGRQVTDTRLSESKVEFWNTADGPGRCCLGSSDGLGPQSRPADSG